MKEFFKKNFVLILAFTLPIVLIAILALYTYLPSLAVSTDYNFVYSVCTDGTYFYQCNQYLQQRYSVVNNKLVVNDIDPAQDSDNDGVPDVNENHTTRLFLHNTAKNESREITLTQAQALNLEGLLTSPDGVTVSGHYDRGSEFVFLFDRNSSYYGYYLTKGNKRSKLNLVHHDDRYYYRNNFHFIGWVLPNRTNKLF